MHWSREVSQCTSSIWSRPISEKLAIALRPKARFASVVGSYGWSSKAVEQVASFIPNLKVEILPPVLCQGFPREKDFAALDDLAIAIAEKHRELNLA